MNNDIQGKKILIMGLGLHGGGVGAARFLAHQGAILTITDLRSGKELAPSLSKLADITGITYVLGRHRKNDFLKNDLIIKNPGVTPASSYLALARQHNIPITTDLGIFLRQCPALVIGVTGTRGKSTTCALIARFLETFFQKTGSTSRVFLGGNIRASVLDFMSMVKPHDVVVLELSSFQLDDLLHDSWISGSMRISPHIAVITNIMRDHLNWHSSMQSYIQAKSALFMHQTKDDFLFANGADKTVKKITARAKSHVVFPELSRPLEKIVDTNLGAHYRASVALAAAVAKKCGVDQATIHTVLADFHGMPGRQEIVATIKRVTYINDTTATIPDASIAAIMRFREKAGNARLVLIAGGSDKKLLFADMAGVIARNVDYLVLLPGSATGNLLKELKKKKTVRLQSIEQADSMKTAVVLAQNHASANDYILLSPGAASFGLFTNEFDRGDQFVRAVSVNH